MTDAVWGAFGNGINDDTVAINNALTAAGNNGGSIVYVKPAGLYHLTNTLLMLPVGVELRGAYENARHWPGAASDGFAKEFRDFDPIKDKAPPMVLWPSLWKPTAAWSA